MKDLDHCVWLCLGNKYHILHSGQNLEKKFLRTFQVYELKAKCNASGPIFKQKGLLWFNF